MGIETLEPLVGTWTMEAVFPDPDRNLPDLRGAVSFAWILDGAFLLQRAEVPHPAAPNVHALIGAAPDGDGFLQHYFDSRGVVREYAMTFADGTWTLSRAPDPPDFHQRFEGQLSPDGKVLTGAWLARSQGEWAKDFDLIYRKS
jgi:hypothetical protein